FLNKDINTPYDLSGTRFRSTPTDQPLFKALGITGISVAPPEMYTALERGVIDGYRWAWRGISSMGWPEVTKYVIDHGFWSGNTVLVMNLDSWNALTPQLQQLVTKVVEDLQPEIEGWMEEERVKEMQRWRDVGMEFIELSPADAEWYVKTAYEVQWNGVIAASPDVGSKLKDLLARILSSVHTIAKCL
ncbi:TRAP transporter substrate-binding protein DctP, partial [Chloroflexota bacterium]